MAHALVVGLAAAIAGGASVALSVAGARRRDGRTILLSAAFSTMTALLLVHALATPDVLALTALPALRRPRDTRGMLFFQAGLFVLVLDLGVIGMLFPAAVPGVPEAGGAAAIALALVGGALFGKYLASEQKRGSSVSGSSRLRLSRYR